MLDSRSDQRDNAARERTGDQAASDPAPSGCIPASWYCVATKWGQQPLAELAMRSDGWRVFFPLHWERTARRIVPLFAGYGFVAFDLEADDWPRLYRTRGVFTILSNNRRPIPLPSGLIENLIDRTSARRIVDDPGQDASVVYLQPGQMARVLDGPLKDFEGVVRLSSQDRITLLLSLFGRESEVRFKPRAVAPA